MFISFLLTVLVVIRLYSVPTSNAKVVPPVLPVVTGVTSNIPRPTLSPTLVPSPTLITAKIVPPTNTPPPSVLPPSEYESFFDEFSTKHGADKELMKRIARCESGINPSSRNGIYGGMFQFAEQTWISTRAEMGLDTNPDLRFSAKDAIEAAAYKIGKHGTGAWAGCL